MMLIDNKFNFGDPVYLVTDPEQSQRLVTQINVKPNGLLYGLSCGPHESWHYDFEISTIKNIFQI